MLSLGRSLDSLATVTQWICSSSWNFAAAFPVPEKAQEAALRLPVYRFVGRSVINLSFPAGDDRRRSLKGRASEKNLKIRREAPSRVMMSFCLFTNSLFFLPAHARITPWDLVRARCLSCMHTRKLIMGVHAALCVYVDLCGTFNEGGQDKTRRSRNQVKVVFIRDVRLRERRSDVCFVRYSELIRSRFHVNECKSGWCLFCCIDEINPIVFLCTA